jgi:hypothetical protein
MVEKPKCKPTITQLGLTKSMDSAETHSSTEWIKPKLKDK